MALSYRSSNLPPEITKLEVPDLSAADGTSRQTRLNVKWDVSDPNDDEMNYTVADPQGRLAELDPAHGDADHGEDVRLGHDGLPLGLLPGEADRQRPAVEQPRRGAGPRPGEPVRSSSITSRPRSP